MVRDKMTRRRAASQWERCRGRALTRRSSRRHLHRPGEEREAMRKLGPRLREPDQVLTNRVAREGEGGRHAPPSNNAGSAYAAFGRSGETGASMRVVVEEMCNHRRELNRWTCG